MARTLSEKQVLKKLGIENFRHLTKDKAIKMASLLDRMDPEVAKKAIEQFPNFSDTMKEILHDYKNSLDKALEENSKGVESFYASCDAIISSLQKELEKENLSFEERKYVVDKMLEVTKMKADKNTEDKRFIATLSLFGMAAVGIAAGVLATALGGNTSIEMNDTDDGDKTL